MDQLRLLLQKELLMWRNSYLRTGKQAAVTLTVATAIAMVSGLIIRAALRWLSPIAETATGALTADLLSPLVMLLLIWLFLLFFFSAAQQSREKFFLTPDLALLMATPANPKIIFALRFLFLAFLTPSGLFEVAVFGLAPLAALGLMTAAPWFYFVLLLPLIYLYRVVPTALAVILIMLLVRFLSPRRLYQALAAGNTLLGGLSFYTLWDGQQAFFGWASKLAETEPGLWLLPSLAAARDLLLGLMTRGGAILEQLIILSGSTILIMAAALVAAERLYYYSYERLQTAEKRSLKKVSPEQGAAGAFRFTERSLLWFLVWEHWKAAARNREMLPAGIFFLALLPVYVLTVERFAGGGLPLIMLLNVAAVAFCAQLATLLSFMPFAMAADRLALSRQYWVYKVTPVEENTFTGSLFWAHCLPSLALALTLIFPVHYFTGQSVFWLLPAAGVLTLLAISSVALQQLTMLLESATAGEELPLPSRIAREAAVLYGPLFVLPLAIGFYYRQIGLLSFMHNLPQPAVMATAIFVTIALAISVTWHSMKRMSIVWQTMEIK